MSQDFSPVSGVPAGCILSAPLFLIFINDITECLKNVNLLMYADDLKIYKKVKSCDDYNEMKLAINNIRHWCNRNRLYMNVKKLKCIICDRSNRNNLGITYKYGDNLIENVESHRDLGVIIDNKLEFKKHVRQIVNKAYSSLGFIRRFASNVFETKIVKLLYCSLVRSHLEYACQVWDPTFDNAENEIEKVQKKFTIFALRCRRDPTTFRYPSYVSRCNKLGIEKLIRRRKNASIFFLYDILKEKINVPELLNRIQLNQIHRRTRFFEFIRLRTYTSIFASRSPMNRMASLFNKIYNYFRDSVSRESFRSMIRKLNDEIVM